MFRVEKTANHNSMDDRDAEYTRLEYRGFHHPVTSCPGDKKSSVQLILPVGLLQILRCLSQKRNYVIHVMNKARKFIDDNSLDQSKLFRASKNLLNLQAHKSLQPHTDLSLKLANGMREYFVHKIFEDKISIRSKLFANTSFLRRCRYLIQPLLQCRYCLL